METVLQSRFQCKCKYSDVSDEVQQGQRTRYSREASKVYKVRSDNQRGRSLFFKAKETRNNLNTNPY